MPLKGKYILPSFLAGKIAEVDYKKWLNNKARSHLLRDRKRIEKFKLSGSGYKEKIHKAVKDSKGIDAYTGESLKWELIGKWSDLDAKEKRWKYKKEFALLPTIDHCGRGPQFKICSWQINDAKGDLTYGEFVQLCKKVIRMAPKLLKGR